MRISIVTTIFRSGSVVHELCDRLAAHARDLAGDDFEILLVDDVSPDDTMVHALACVRRDPHVAIVELARRQGQYAAIRAGLAECRGDRVFLIDGDLEEPPETLTRCWRTLDASAGDVDVVYGTQRTRRDAGVRRIGGQWFYRALSRLGPVPVPADTTVARLMTRRYVDALLRFPERPISFDVWTALAGFRQVPIDVEKAQRGPTTYSYLARVRLALFVLTAVGAWPIAMVATVGAVLGALALVLALAARRETAAALGPAATLAAFAAIAALVTSALALAAYYFWLLLEERRARPVVVRRVVRAGDVAAASR